MNDHLLPIYNKQSVTFTHGDGIWLYDESGKQYLDTLTGIGVSALGHNHPTITKAITEQAKSLLHVPNTYNSKPLLALAQKLCELTGLSKAYFSNSGAEATEAAIKMALKYGTSKGIKTPKIIVMTQAFHGRSLGSWSASCDQTNSQFGPLIPSFTRVQFNDIDAMKDAITDDTVAIMLEPVLGKGGLMPADISYLETARELCNRHDLLLIFDEIQSGMGRTGKLFAYQHSTIKPDILTTAKALGNGVPIGAFITSEKAVDIFQPGDHGSTQGGNPFACQVALAVINTMLEDKLIERAAKVGDYLQAKLEKALAPFSQFDGIQGKGLMIGMRIKKPIPHAIRIGLDHGIIFNFANKKVIRILPPLIMTESDADVIVEKMVACFDDF